MSGEVVIYLCVGNKDVLKGWQDEFKREKWGVVLVEDVKSLKELLKNNSLNYLAIVEFQRNSYSDLMSVLEIDQMHIIVCGSGVSNDEISSILLKGAIDWVDIHINPLLLRSKIIAHLRRMISDFKEQFTIPSNSTQIISSLNKEVEIRFNRMIAIIKLDKSKEEIRLSKKEIYLLAILILNEGRIIKRDEIIERIWSEKFGEVNSEIVDKYIQILRKKLKSLGENIKTIYGMGYMYKVDKDSKERTKEYIV